MNAFHTDIENIIAENLDNAQNHIKINVTWFTSQKLFQALLSAVQRGVSVQLIIYDDEINANSPIDFNTLSQKSSKVYYFKHETAVNHEKFCIIDSKTLIYGSFNWTYKAAHYNIESIIVASAQSDGYEMIKQFEKQFSRLLAHPAIHSEEKEAHVQDDEQIYMPVAAASVLKSELYFLEAECSYLQTQTEELKDYYKQLSDLINFRLFDYIVQKLELQKVGSKNSFFSILILKNCRTH